MDQAPDPRVLQANERTFLAWVRTSLAVGAAGLGIAGLAPVTDPKWVRPAIAVLVTALALAFLAWAVKRFRAAEAAIRSGDEIPRLEHAALLAGGLGAVLALVVLALLLAT
jgi:putative membrane protein